MGANYKGKQINTIKAKPEQKASISSKTYQTRKHMHADTSSHMACTKVTLHAQAYGKGGMMNLDRGEFRCHFTYLEQY